MSVKVDRNARFYERLGQYPDGYKASWQTLPPPLEEFLIPREQHGKRRTTQDAELTWIGWEKAFPDLEPPVEDAKLATISIRRVMEFRKGQAPAGLGCVSSMLRYSVRPERPDLDTGLPGVAITRIINILPLEHQLREADFLVNEYDRITGLNQQTEYRPSPTELGAVAILLDLH
jgi:hypothetical protein